MSSEPKRTSRARPLPISRGSRAMGPPPATSPTPTSHCDRTAFSRLAELMSPASGISLPFPVPPPPLKANRHQGRASQPHQDVRPRLQAGGALRYAGQFLEFCEEIGVIKKEAFDSTLKDDNLNLLVGFELRHDFLELQNKFRTHEVEWRVVKCDSAISW